MSFLKRIKDLGESASHRANLRKKKVATDLAILIAKAGLRRKDVAIKLEISEAALSSRLRGNANLSLDTIGSNLRTSAGLKCSSENLELVRPSLRHEVARSVPPFLF